MNGWVLTLVRIAIMRHRTKRLGSKEMTHVMEADCLHSQSHPQAACVRGYVASVLCDNSRVASRGVIRRIA